MHAPASPTTAITVSTSHPDSPTNPPACDEMQPNVTFCNTSPENALPKLTPANQPGTTLTSRQLTAISLLCAGNSVEQAAAKLHIHRVTLHRWRTSNPYFRAELHRRQRDLHDTASRRLRLLLLRAIEMAAERLKEGDWTRRHDAALALLRHLDVSALLAPPTALTADHCADELIRADRRARNLDPTLPVTDDDRDLLLASLPTDDPADNAPIPPTHRRLIGTHNSPPEPYPTPDTAPPPDPEFQI